MLAKSWRRLRSPAAWALALVLGTPMLAEAQQSGLFPLAPIRRQRVPCPMENPVYGLYRHEYFGYHPTCWRRFPAGWGCPSPEAPNVVAAFDPNQGGRKRDKPTVLTPEEAGPLEEPGMEGPPMPGLPGGDALPPVPPADRSPFDLDTTPGTPPPARPGGGRSAPPPPAETNPLELPPPADTEKSDSLPPTTRMEPAPPVEADSAPLLALPEPSTVPAGAAPGPALMAPSSAPPAAGPAAYMPTAPVQAPRRTSMLGGLFNGLRRR